MADPADLAAASHAAFDPLPIVILLAAAVIAVPVFRKIGLGSVLGYLAAGLAIGPYGFGFFNDAQAIIHVAEMGVVLFLFVIGLEMQPSRLWSMRGEIFGLGAAQVLLAIGVLLWVGVAQGFPIEASFIAGTGFVLTSTAIVMQVLAERKELAQPRGRKMVAVLLFEDLAIVPLLALVAFLAPGGAEATLADRLWSVAMGIGAIAVLVIAGRWCLNPMFRILARFGAREVMTAAALLVALGAAVLMDAGGLSMAMGAFLAGVLLSESTFRHQLEADIEPFRGLLLGLFFLGVGMALNLDVIAANWTIIAISVPAYMILKMFVIYGVARLFKAPHEEALDRSVLMAQGGEFAFVLYASATSFGILTPEWNANLTAIIILSMVLTPLILIAKSRLPRTASAAAHSTDDIQSTEAAVLLIGFGRFGQMVSQPLLRNGCALTIIDKDADQIHRAAQYGFRVYYGDGARADILHAAGVHDASLVIVAIDEKADATRIVSHIKHEYPLVPVFVRAAGREHAVELSRAGADFQMRETLESAFATAQAALIHLGESPETVDEILHEVRVQDAARLDDEILSNDTDYRNYIVGNNN